jgi:hypothetical protein
MTPDPNSSVPEHSNNPENAIAVNGSISDTAADTPESDHFTIEITNPDFLQPGTANSLMADDPITQQTTNFFPASVITLGAVALMILGLAIDNVWLGYLSAVVALLTGIRMIWPSWGKVWTTLIPPVWRGLVIASFGDFSCHCGVLDAEWGKSRSWQSQY